MANYGVPHIVVVIVLTIPITPHMIMVAEFSASHHTPIVQQHQIKNSTKMTAQMHNIVSLIVLEPEPVHHIRREIGLIHYRLRLLIMYVVKRVHIIEH